MSIKESYDFSCWLVKYDRPIMTSPNIVGLPLSGRLYQKNCLKSNDGMIVPLCWNHQHNDPCWVLGRALLENREEGIYVYGYLYDTSCRGMIDQLIRDRGTVSTSPFITQVTWSGDSVVGGTIREVSLTPARIDPSEDYYPIMRQDTE